MQRTGRNYLIPVLLAIFSPLAAAQSTATETVFGQVVAAREVLFRPQPWAFNSSRQLVQPFDAEVVQPIGGSSGWVRLKSRSLDVLTLLSGLSLDPQVASVEPNYIVHSSDTLPNDLNFNNLWGLHNTGQTISGQIGAPFADIDAVKAWDIGTGSSDVVVGVVDTGVDYTHPDLAANIWTARAPYQISLGGVTFTCPAGGHGFNARDMGCDPLDNNTHGTHVSGIIGAVGNNLKGVTGINWTTAIASFKFLDANGSGTVADGINAIEAAVQLKAQGIAIRVLNNSWGVGSYSGALLQAVNDANSSGMLFVAAAGNDASDNDGEVPEYPASFNAPNIVSAAATNNLDHLASFSNYGPTTVHLGAPGVDIQSTLLGGGYGFLSGTSMAAPHVSGAAALVLSKCALSTADLKTAILNSVDPIPSLASKTISGGRLNVYKALNYCGAGPAAGFSLSATPASVSAAPGGAAHSQINITRFGGFSGPVALTANGVPAGVTASFSPATILNLAVSSNAPAGIYPITVQGSSGSLVSSAIVTLTVVAADFSISASPASVSATAGGSAASTITVAALGGFSGVVNLTATGLPPGVTAAFSSAAITASGNASLTLAAAAGTSAGAYTITVQGVSGSLVHTTTVGLAIAGAPDFSLAAAPAAIGVPSGGSATSAITITALSGFSGVVGLTANGLPAGVTASFSPGSVPGSGTSTLTLAASAGAPAGTSAITVQGVSGNLTHTANLSLTVTNQPSINLPANVSVLPGLSAPFAVSLTAPAVGGVYISLTSSDASKASVTPSNVFIPAGSTTSSIVPKVNGINLGSATIAASAANYAPVSQQVQVPDALSFFPTGVTFTAAGTQFAALTLASPLPTDLIVTLSSDNANVATVPATLTFRANTTSLTVRVTSTGGGATLIHANALPNVPDVTLSVTVGASLAITTPSLPSGQLRTPYSQTLAASGGTLPYVWALTSGALPPGLMLNVSTGLISGTPTAAVTNSPLIFMVSDASIPARTATAALALTIAASGSPASITAVRGTPQSAAVNTAFGSPLGVLVKDATGSAVSGVIVTFLAPSTGATGSFAGGLNTAATDASGMAASPAFTANSTAGPFTVTASVAGVTNPAAFSLTNLAGPAASIAVTSGSGQSAAVNTSFAAPLLVTVQDAGGNPVSGAAVTFMAPSSGASLSFAGPNVVTTNASGVASSPALTANGTAGKYTILASAPGVALPAGFSLTNTGPPANLVVVGGGGQSATVNTSFLNPLAVKVTDAVGSALPGVGVMFTAPGSGPSGVFSGSNNATATAVTNAAGVATSTTFTANSLGGNYTVTAAVPGIAIPASFLLTNLSGIILPANVSVAPGASAPFPVALGVPAPSGGVFLALASSDPSTMTITPATVVIPAGATSPPSPPRINGINLGSAAITASAWNFTPVSQQVQVVDGLSFYPASVTMNAGAAQYLTLNLSAPTSADLTVALNSSNPSVATIPPSVTFRANTTSATVRVTGVAPGSATITGSALPNVSLAAASVTVQ